MLDLYLIPVINGFAYGLLLFVVAAGLTLAFGVADVLNLAHGTVYVVGGYAAATLTDGSWGGLLLAIAVGCLAGAACGGLLSVAVAPLTGRGHLAQALLTFGIALVGGALLVYAFGADDLRPTLPEALTEPVLINGQRYSGYRLSMIGLGVILAVVIWFVITRTRAGARVRAMVDDPGMVASLGTNPRTILNGVMVAAGALAGTAGAIGAPLIGPGPGTANQVLLMSLVIVVVGGLGSVLGAFVAALVVGQVQALGPIVAETWAPYLLFVAMAVALLVRRPQSLLPGGAR
ncbi:branched-chain amino acid ABC transporter permease [Stackebrandtia nassauensis]|uniref:Inner-membrane translocator n=1 Tax=Stackebrandtia nassauensis (strain DSM 44728 / CIP 108903 / NRRL B-16338 / NBRC 102104 / LLR-40K-21) TaxID=446470 RepID=D3Q8E8_STANL|nr:branched-chain amino acid ABC transporter permease [Stackebrandtia nassauensis]ADD42522.1 inner-membrane translocator [Stackebrandtia nassauensis DSM 44728]